MKVMVYKSGRYSVVYTEGLAIGPTGDEVAEEFYIDSSTDVKKIMKKKDKEAIKEFRKKKIK